MGIQDLATWLRCPHCGRDLDPVAPLTLSCSQGHSFDVNRRGQVNLLGPKPAVIGDTAAMLASRDQFLDAGHYGTIRDALVTALTAHIAPLEREPRIIDAGCGTGYYLEGVLSALQGPTSALGFDVSPLAVLRTLRRTDGGCSGLVADTWSPLPLRSGTADALYTVFAPRNLTEFHRTLTPNGVLIVVVPTAHHLRELRTHAAQALDVPAEKAARLIEEAAALFIHTKTTLVEYAIDLVASEAAELVRMGPAGHHRSEEQLRAIPGGQATVSINVVSFVSR